VPRRLTSWSARALGGAAHATVGTNAARARVHGAGQARTELATRRAGSSARLAPRTTRARQDRADSGEARGLPCEPGARPMRITEQSARSGFGGASEHTAHSRARALGQPAHPACPGLGPWLPIDLLDSSASLAAETHSLRGAADAVVVRRAIMRSKDVAGRARCRRLAAIEVEKRRGLWRSRRHRPRRCLLAAPRGRRRRPRLALAG
jgi:hypothetical protein